MHLLEEEVLGLEVSVDDGLLVHGDECLEDAAHDDGGVLLVVGTPQQSHLLQQSELHQIINIQKTCLQSSFCFWRSFSFRWS